VGWLRDIDQWFIAEILPHKASFRSRAAQAGDAADAEDLVQEAFVKVLTAPNFRAIAHPRAYVQAILHNLMVERARRAQVVRIDYLASLDVLDLADPAPDAFQQASAKAELARTLAMIDTLPAQCAKVLHMRKVEGMSPRQIADCLDLSLSTVEKHLAKALILIAKARQQHDEAPETDGTQAWIAPPSRQKTM
jgi:RNA polymerase sigma factor (sigma-70 family)